MKLIPFFLILFLFLVPSYAEATSCSKYYKGDTETDVSEISVTPKDPQKIPVFGIVAATSTPSIDIISGVAGFLSDRASAMAIDIAEDELFRSLCKETNNAISEYLPRTCQAYKINRSITSQLPTPSLSWLPTPLKEDLRFVPACIYRNKNNGSADGYVLTAAIQAINNGQSTIKVLAGIQDVDEVKNHCTTDDQSSCWLYYPSLLAHAQQSTVESNSNALLCYKFAELLPQSNAPHIDPACANKKADYERIANRLNKFKTDIEMYKNPDLSNEARKYLAANFLTDLTAYFSLANLDDSWIPKTSRTDMKNWLALLQTYAAKDYEQAGLTLMNNLGCQLDQPDPDNKDRHGANNKNDSKLCSSLVLVGSLAQAENTNDVKQILDASVAPADAWRRRSGHTILDLGSVVGFRYEFVRTNSNGINEGSNGYGLSAPVGLSLTMPKQDIRIIPNFLPDGAYGVMVPIMDFGGALTYSKSQQSGTTTVTSQQSWRSVIAPGIMVRWQPDHYPLVVLAGCEWSPAVRQATFADGTQQDISGKRCMISVGMDLLLFPLISQ